MFTGPSALQVTTTKNITNLSVALQWNKVNDSLPTTYVVTWTSERDHILQVKTLIEQSSYTITELTLDTVYTITVTANNRCGTGPEFNNIVLLATYTNSTISSLSSTSANPMTIMPAANSSSTSTATAIMIANSSFATTSSSAAYITQHSTTTTTVMMSPGTTTTIPITTTVSKIADTTNSFTKTAGFKSTTGSVNPSTSVTTIVLSSTSTANPPDTTTADETSKFSDIKHIASYIIILYSYSQIHS